MCREWEARAREVNQEDVRLVLLRIGVVLGKDGGALGWFLLRSIFAASLICLGFGFTSCLN